MTDLYRRIIDALREEERRGRWSEDTIDCRIAAAFGRVADALEGPTEAEREADRQAAEAEAERRLAEMDRWDALEEARQERIRKELEEANRIPVDSLELLNRVRKAKQGNPGNPGEPTE